jgi:hypothetical protein
MPFRNLYTDNFDNGVVDLSTDLGNGNVVEGGYTISLPGGSVDGNWWGGATVHNAPIAYRTGIAVSGYERYTTRINAAIYNATDCAFGLAFYKDRDNGYLFVWYGGTSKVYAEGIVANGPANGGSYELPGSPGAVIANPNTTSLLLRIHYDVAASHVSFEYSVNEGGLWTAVTTDWDDTIDPTRIGMLVKSTLGTPWVFVNFSYFKIERSTDNVVWTDYFVDDFLDGVDDYTKDAPYGSFDNLQTKRYLVSTLSGVDGNWTTGVYNSPIIYRQDIALSDQERYTTVLYRSNVSDTTTFPGMALYLDRSNVYWFGYYPLDLKLYVQKVINGTFAAVAATAAGLNSSPNVTPVTLRITYTVSTKILIFEYSINDGATWINVTTTAAIEFTPLRIGLFTKNWTTFPSVYARFSYFLVERNAGAGWSNYYLNNFNDGIDSDWLGDIYTGACQEDKGELIFTGQLGINTDWGAGATHYAPIAYKTLATYLDPAWEVYYVETELTWFLASADTLGTALTLWQDRDNAYSLYYKRVAGVGSIGVRKLLANAETISATTAITTPGVHTYRIYYNPLAVGGGNNRDIVVGQTTYTLAPKDLKFFASINKGRTWTLIDTKSTIGEFEPTRFGIYAGNDAASTPAFSVKYNHLSLYQFKPTAASPAGRWRDDETDVDSKVYLGGQNIQAVKLIDTTVSPFGSPSDADFWYAGADGIYRADGIACAPGLLTDGTGTLINRQSWRDPTQNPNASSDPYGTVVPVGLDLVKATITNPVPGTFKFAYIDTFRTWCFTGDFEAYVYLSSVTINAYQIWFFISIEECWQPGHYNSVRIERSYRNAGLHEFTSMAWVNGVGPPTSYPYSSSGNAPGAWSGLKVKRVGSTITTHYKTAATEAALDAAAWVALYPGGGFALNSRPMIMRLILENGAGTGNGFGSWHKFTIISGTTSNKTGLYRESASLDRGSGADVPNTLAVVGTDKSMDLIDVTNNKLFKRFLIGYDNALSKYGDEKQQISNINYREDGQIDLTTGAADSIGGNVLRCYLQTCGLSIFDSAGYRTYDHTENLGDLQLPVVNSARGWMPNDNTSQLPASAVLDVCSYIPSYILGDPYHVAVATKNGLLAYTGLYNQYWPAGSNPSRVCTSTESGIIYKCFMDQSDGTLYGMSATNLFSASLATYMAAMPYGVGDSIGKVGSTCTITDAATTFDASMIGKDIYINWNTNAGNSGVFPITAAAGHTISYTNANGAVEASSFTWSVRNTFASDTTKALPGTRTIRTQYSFIVLSGTVYVCANEGIYSCAWPAGTFSLTYGEAGSGAPYRLPVNTRLSAIKLVYEGVNPFIMVTAWDSTLGQSKVFLINPTTHLLDRYLESDVANGEVITVDAV